MKLLDARVNGMPRQVNTKYGDKSVLDVATSEGNYTIWRPAGDFHNLSETLMRSIVVRRRASFEYRDIEEEANQPDLALVRYLTESLAEIAHRVASCSTRNPRAPDL
jgi:hypothetical protein